MIKLKNSMSKSKKCPKSCDLGQIHLFRGWRRQPVRAKKARLFGIVGVICCNAAELMYQNEKMFDGLAGVFESVHPPSGLGELG